MACVGRSSPEAREGEGRARAAPYLRLPTPYPALAAPAAPLCSPTILRKHTLLPQSEVAKPLRATRRTRPLCWPRAQGLPRRGDRSPLVMTGHAAREPEHRSTTRDISRTPIEGGTLAAANSNTNASSTNTFQQQPERGARSTLSRTSRSPRSPRERACAGLDITRPSRQTVQHRKDKPVRVKLQSFEI